MTKDYICRVCSVELGIKRTSKKWAAIGTCPYCQERHALYIESTGENETKQESEK